MKILFLDIDGVLNSKRTFVAFDRYPHSFHAHEMDTFDPVAIQLIRKLCDETSCKIVLSSDWRYDYTAQEAANAFALPIIDVTPKMAVARGIEISAWLKQYPEVEIYAVVDDNELMFDAHDGKFVQTHDGKFVQTNEETGLSLRNYLDLKQILSGGLVW